jgi:hypothetical protein
MSKVLQINLNTHGTTKVVITAQWKQAEVAVCKLTWFPLQETAHVWLSVPALHDRHAVTSFQKFKGTFQDLVHAYMSMFQQIMWLLVPVLQGASSVDMLLFRLKGLNPAVSALVRALVMLKKKSMEASSKPSHDHSTKDTPSSSQKRNSGHRVDDGASNPDVAHRSKAASR